MVIGLTIAAYCRGFVPIAASTMSLGPQNSFVLRRGLSRNSLIPAVAICFLCDCALICTGILTFPAKREGSDIVRSCLLGAGCLYLVVFGVGYLRSAALSKRRCLITHDGCAGFRTALIAAAAVTLLNPLAYVETMLVPAGLAATLASAEVPAFIGGAISGAAMKFALLGLAARCMARTLSTAWGQTAFALLSGGVMIGTSLVLLKGLLLRF